MNLWQQIGFLLQVVKSTQRWQFSIHLNMSIKYIEKKNKDEDIISEYNLKVLQKYNKNIKWIEKTVNYATFLVYDLISKEWCRSNVSGPLFLVRLSNTKPVLYFLNQVNNHN